MINVKLSLATADKVMTLNGLSNGYKPDPSSNNGNPMSVVPTIFGPTDENPNPSDWPAIRASGYDFQGWENEITYNLPDGGLLSITIGLKCNTNRPQGSDNYAMTYNSGISSSNYYIVSEHSGKRYDFELNGCIGHIELTIDLRGS